MSQPQPTLHMLCGKIAAGKSTLAAELAEASNAILISEDQWLAALFKDQMSSVADYVRCSTRLRLIIGPHVVQLLKSRLSVVLDFPANTVEQRNWMRGIFQEAEALNALHLLNTSDAECKARLRDRNARGDHAFAATESQFDQITKFFVPPAQSEGFNVVIHSSSD